VWTAKVEEDHVCDSYERYSESEENAHDNDLGNGVGMSEYGMLYSTDGAVDSADDGLIWKTVLRTGRWALRPGPGQRPVPQPLTVVEGPGTPPNSVGFADIVAAFQENAVQHVTIPLSHADRVDENTGYVRDLRVEDDPDRPGEKVLRAGLEFTDQSIKQKVLDRSIANTSMGLRWDYSNKESGKRYKVVAEHVALTNNPWINGMRPFGLSEDEAKDKIDQFELSETTTKDYDKNVTVNVTVNVPQTGTSAAEQQFSEVKEPRKPSKEVHMSLPKELEGLDLADEAAAKVMEILQAKETEAAEAKRLADEATQLAADLTENQRKAGVDKRIDELKAMGLSEQSGFLKTVRQVLLADTGENKLTFSEDGKDETITFSDVVNKLIGALPQKDGKIDFSEMAQSLGVERAEAPAKDAVDENKSAEDKYAEAYEFLHGTKPPTKS
jgi:hypothetical protein